MRTKLSILLGLLAVTGLLAAWTSSAPRQVAAQTSTQSSTPLRTIAVNGTGKVYLTPDIAYVTIGVHTENKDAALAVAENTKKAEDVKQAVIDMGVEAKDIQTVNFSIYPQQQYDPNGRPTGEINYMVDNMLMVAVRDLEQIGELLDAVVQAGANSISGISFDVADRSAALSEARIAAVDDAEAQAKELAAAAGVTLGPVFSISTLGVTQPYTVYEKGLGGGAAVAAPAAVPVSPGQMLVQVDVNVVYEIR
jgi:uncharacterized protein YggE